MSDLDSPQEAETGATIEYAVACADGKTRHTKRVKNRNLCSFDVTYLDTHPYSTARCGPHSVVRHSVGPWEAVDD